MIHLRYLVLCVCATSLFFLSFSQQCVCYLQQTLLLLSISPGSSSEERDFTQNIQSNCSMWWYPGILCPYIIMGLLSSRNRFFSEPNSKSVSSDYHFMSFFCDIIFLKLLHHITFSFHCLHHHFFLSFSNSLILHPVFCIGMNHRYITFHHHYYSSFHINKLAVVKFLYLIRSKFACTFLLILVQLLQMLK